MWFSKIDGLTCQGLKVTPDNIKNSITIVADLLNFQKFGFGTIVGLRDTYNFHLIWALPVFVKRLNQEHLYIV